MKIPTNMIHFVFDESEINKERPSFAGTAGLLDPFELKNIQIIGTIIE